jgi:hypothetical protein
MLQHYPSGATTLHFEYYTNTTTEASSPGCKSKSSASNVVVSIHLDNVDQMQMSLGEIMDLLLSSYDVPEDKQVSQQQQQNKKSVINLYIFSQLIKRAPKIFISKTQTIL